MLERRDQKRLQRKMEMKVMDRIQNKKTKQLRNREVNSWVEKKQK